jgi:hypothetical protein
MNLGGLTFVIRQKSEENSLLQLHAKINQRRLEMSPRAGNHWRESEEWNIHGFKSFSYSCKLQLFQSPVNG